MDRRLGGPMRDPSCTVLLLVLLVTLSGSQMKRILMGYHWGQESFQLWDLSIAGIEMTWLRPVITLLAE